MKKTPKTHPNNERGQSLTELAVSMVVLLMLLTGAVETSLALFQFVTIRDAAQEAALYGSFSMKDPMETSFLTDIKWRAIKAADDVVTLSPDNVKVFINDTEFVNAASPPGNACEGAISSVPNSIRVEITYQHPIVFPFVGAMIGKNFINLGASSTNTILAPAC